MRPSLTTILILLATSILSAQQIKISIDTSQTTGQVPPQFIGLSYETRALLPQSDTHYFRPDNQPLIQIFKTLGVKNLRVGGNTVDDPTVPTPQRPDIDSVFNFAKAADAQVIYSIRLKNGDPAAGAATAKYLMSHFAAQLYCLCIGNEPNVYEKQYPTYQKDYQRFLSAILAAAPDVMVCGPSTTPGKVEWVIDFARDFAPTGHVKFLTQHSYPGGSAKKVTNPAAARDDMLAGFTKANQHMYDLIAPISQKYHVPYRLEEANSYFHGGAKDVSNTFASTLWGLQYMYWWASHGAIGVNFHTGDHVASDNKFIGAQYSVFTSSNNGYDVRPLAYSLLAFHLAGAGPLAQVQINPDSSQLTAYATEPDPHSLIVTIINKSYGTDAPQQSILISTDHPFHHASTIDLRQSDNDPAATTGITLGGTPINPDGTWNGKWTRQSLSNDGKELTLTVSPASATIVHLSR